MFSNCFCMITVLILVRLFHVIHQFNVRFYLHRKCLDTLLNHNLNRKINHHFSRAKFWIFFFFFFQFVLKFMVFWNWTGHLIPFLFIPMKILFFISLFLFSTGDHYDTKNLINPNWESPILCPVLSGIKSRWSLLSFICSFTDPRGQNSSTGQGILSFIDRHTALTGDKVIYGEPARPLGCLLASNWRFGVVKN